MEPSDGNGTIWQSAITIAVIALIAMIISAVANLSMAQQEQQAETPEKGSVYFFWGKGCPHCAAAKPFLDKLAKRYPALEIKSYEVYENQENLEFMERLIKAYGKAPRGVPTFIYGDKVFEGYSDNIAREIESAVSASFKKQPPTGLPGDEQAEGTDPEQVTVPFLGTKDFRSVSLPVFTLIIAGLDSFNPCAFFVLFTLLSLLLHAHSRKKILFIGGIFIIFSGGIYFMFMATWLNLFLIIGNISAVTFIAGIVALIIAVINIKDYFLYKKGISLSIPDTSKPKLYEKMRRLLKTDSLPALLAGTIVLATTANSYELLCTAGFPMIYTRVLTFYALSTKKYYAFLALYNLIYILPLAIIIVIFATTLGNRKFTEQQGRILKLISGSMMFFLAIALLLAPSLLQSPLTAATILAAALVLSLTIVFVTRKRNTLPGCCPNKRK